MHLETLLNACHKFTGFVYAKARWKVLNNGERIIAVQIRPRKKSKARCVLCQQPAPGYDRLKPRKFWFIPLWGFRVMFVYVRRRVTCAEHGIQVEWLPWAEGKSPLVNAFKIYLAQWVKHLPVQTVATLFHVTWQNVFAAVKYVVDYGLQHRCLDNIRSIGVDEIHYRAGYKFLTLVYQIDASCRRLLYVGQDRTVKSLLRFFRRFGKERNRGLKAVSCDMWKPYLKVIAKKAVNAIIILDRFHIMKYFNDAIDTMRRQEARQLAKDGHEEILKHSRWCLLKNKKNQTASQLAKLKDLVKYNLKVMKCRLLREAFNKFWHYQSVTWAKKFLRQWMTRVMRSRLEPMKKVARMLRAHEELILNWFCVNPRLSNGVAEGFNNKAKLVMRKSYGFKQFQTIEIMLYHILGNLPLPPRTHRFL